MFRNRARTALVALIFSQIIWGLSPAVSKLTLLHIPLFTFAFLRFMIPTVILLPLVWHKFFDIRQKDFIRLVAIGFLAIVVNITFFFLGLKLTQSINVQIIDNIGPLLLLIGATLFLREKPRKKVILGNILSFAGAMFIALEPLFQIHSAESLIGNIFLLISMLAVVAATLIDKEINTKYDPLVITTWSFFIGTLLFLPLFFHDLLSWNGFQIYSRDSISILGIFYSAFGASLIAYTLYFWGLKYSPLSQVGMISYISPIVSVAAGNVLLHEQPSLFFLIGAGFVAAGIVLAEFKPHHHLVRK